MYTLVQFKIELKKKCTEILLKKRESRLRVKVSLRVKLFVMEFNIILYREAFVIRIVLDTIFYYVLLHKKSLELTCRSYLRFTLKKHFFDYHIK